MLPDNDSPYPLRARAVALVNGFKYGRKKPLLGAVALELVAGLAAALTPEFWSFLLFRAFIGASIGGIMIINFVLLIEFTGKKHRELSSCLVQLPFNFGYLLLPVLGYYIRTWQSLQVAYSVSAAGLVLFYWFLPETPRWLLTTGNTEGAVAVLTKAAKINGRPTEGIKDKVLLYQKTIPAEVERGSLLDLFRTPNIRRNMICISVNWVVCGLGFFGLSQYIGQLSGDIFINIAISAALNSLGTLVSYLVMKLMNRRTTLLVMNIGTSVCLFAIAVIPEEGALIKVILACVGNVGMFVVFVVVYLYTTELFPTTVRNVAMGVASMLARIGSMVAPFIVALGLSVYWLPPVIFGAAPLVAAILCLFIPETKGSELPNTIEEGELFGVSAKKNKLCTKNKYIINS